MLFIIRRVCGGGGGDGGGGVHSGMGEGDGVWNFFCDLTGGSKINGSWSSEESYRSLLLVFV